MRFINYHGTQYEITVEGNDIVLQSETQDIVIEGGYGELKADAIRTCKFPTQGEDGLEWDWNPDSVEEEIMRNIEAFADFHACDGIIINHN